MSSLWEYRGVHARIDYDPDADCFTGRIPGQNRSRTFRAKTLPELREAFQRKVDRALSENTGSETSRKS